MISPNNGDDFLRHEFGFPFSIFLGGVQGSSNDVISHTCQEGQFNLKKIVHDFWVNFLISGIILIARIAINNFWDNGPQRKWGIFDLAHTLLLLYYENQFYVYLFSSQSYSVTVMT